MNKRPIFDNDTAATRALYREIVQRLDGLVVIQRLESQLKEAEGALREIKKDLAFHQSRGLDGPCDCKTHRALDAYFATYREVKP